MVLRPLVGTRFQALFHLRLTGLLFIFRSRYFCAIGRPGVLSLGRWASRIQAGFHVSDPTWGHRTEGTSFAYRPITFCGAAFQRPSARKGFCDSVAGSCSPACEPRDPERATRRAWHALGLGSSLFARRYWGSRGFFPFPRVLRCVSSPRSPPHPIYSDADTRALPRVGCPIRRSPDQSKWQLPGAYRS